MRLITIEWKPIIDIALFLCCESLPPEIFKLIDLSIMDVEEGFQTNTSVFFHW